MIRASMVENGVLKPHPVGIYLQTIPTDMDSHLSAIPYQQAQEYGYLKIDLLHLNLLKSFESRDEVLTVLNMKPDWTLLNYKSVVEKLFHIKKHFDLIEKCKPQSIEDLADILALIRPNKTILIDKYIKSKHEVRKVLYDKIDESDLRKSHAIAYALNIILQMNLIKLGADI
jgi:DNA polymerase III alpha subunit